MLDQFVDLQAVVRNLEARVATLEAAGKPLADQLTPPILRPAPIENVPPKVIGKQV